MDERLLTSFVLLAFGLLVFLFLQVMRLMPRSLIGRTVPSLLTAAVRPFSRLPRSLTYDPRVGSLLASLEAGRKGQPFIRLD